MQFLLRILLIPLILALHGIDGRIHVQPVACSEAISHLNDISSLDYLIDIQQLDDDDEDRASISVTVHGKTSAMTFNNVTLAAKDRHNRSTGIWEMKDPSVGAESSERAMHSTNANQQQVAAILHINDESLMDIRVEITIARDITTVYLHCYDVALVSDVSPSDSSLNNENQVTTLPNTLSATSVTQTPSPTANVGVNITWTYDSNKVTRVKMLIFNMNSGQWAALGLSHDGSMGQSHVFICRRLSNDTVDGSRHINPRGHAPPEPAGSEQGGVFTVESQGINNGVVFCQFTLSNFSSTDKGRPNALEPLSQSTPYYPIFGIGQLDSSNELKQHGDDSHDSLTQIVVLNRAESFTFHVSPATDNSKAKLIKAHGIIMVFTWIFIASTGMILARYFKSSWPKRTICGKPVWFATHRLLMSLVSTLTLLGFMFVLVYAGGKWVNDGDVNAHAIMGAIVTGLAFIQPFMALFRCDPDSRYRFIFNYFHALVGTSALILSLATLFLATTNFKGIFSTHTGWILMTVWTCWLVCLCVVLECLQRWNPSDSTMLSKNYSGISTVNDQEMADASPHLGQILQPSTIQKQERWKMILFLLHLSVAVGISIALVITIATFD